MVTRLLYISLCFYSLTFAQQTLDNFISRAVENSPVLKDYRSQSEITRIDQKINSAENSAFQVSLTSDYLFVPYFNNNGQLVTTDPSPEAVGYDINIFDGGLYSAQLNLERNIFNGRLTDARESQIRIRDQSAGYDFNLEKHTLVKEVTDQYLTTYQDLLLIRLSEEVTTTLAEQLKLTGELLGKGFVRPQDYLLLKIELKNQQIALRNARENYRSSLYRLDAMCGITDTALVTLEQADLNIESPPSESMFMHRFDLDSMTTVNEQELFEVRYTPQIRLFFNTGLNAVELHNMQRKFGMSAGLALSLPLYDGGQKSLTRQKSSIASRTIGTYRQFTARNIKMKRDELVSHINILKQNIRDLSHQVSDYQDLLQLSEAQLQQGNTTMIDHLILTRNFTEIRRNKIEAEINYQLQINAYNYWSW